MLDLGPLVDRRMAGMMSSPQEAASLRQPERRRAYMCLFASLHVSDIFSLKFYPAQLQVDREYHRTSSIYLNGPRKPK